MEQKKIVIYIRSWNPRCWRTKQFFRRKGYAFEVFNVTDDGQHARFAHFTDRRAVLPYVFVDHRPVGGLATIKALDCSGDLDRLVRGEI
jgi:thioredoxin reductase (NADPH)